MQSHQTIDLLPDRKKETAAAWMSAHPEIDAGRAGIAEEIMQQEHVKGPRKRPKLLIGSTCWCAA